MLRQGVAAGLSAAAAEPVQAYRVQLVQRFLRALLEVKAAGQEFLAFRQRFGAMGYDPNNVSDLDPWTWFRELLATEGKIDLFTTACANQGVRP